MLLWSPIAPRRLNSPIYKPQQECYHLGRTCNEVCFLWQSTGMKPCNLVKLTVAGFCFNKIATLIGRAKPLSAIECCEF
jgi:hypothetical protein